MNLYNVLMEMSDDHVRIKKGGYSDLLYFDLKNKTIKNGKIILVENGIIKPQTIKLTNGKEFMLEDDWGEIKDEFYNGIEKRFEKYYLSMPSKAERFVRSNFMAKPTNKMSYQDLQNSTSNRAKARYELEWFVMASAVNGNIKWKNDRHWFWKSSKYPKLIIYKEFI